MGAAIPGRSSGSVVGTHVEHVTGCVQQHVPLHSTLGDEDRLAQALLNVAVNARLHTPAGTPVRVGAHISEGEILFEVVDEGPGVDPSVLPDAFQPFATTRSAGADRSSGLGLAVVKAVTQAQGGRVDLHSTPAGTSVQLIFPTQSTPSPESADLR